MINHQYNPNAATGSTPTEVYPASAARLTPCPSPQQFETAQRVVRALIDSVEDRCDTRFAALNETELDALRTLCRFENS